MNPQLEQHLEDFDQWTRSDDDIKCLKDDVQQDLFEDYCDSDSCKDNNKSACNSEAFPWENILSLGGMIFGVLVLAVTEWKHVFVLRIEITIGSSVLVLPASAIGFLGVIYLFVNGGLGFPPGENTITSQNLNKTTKPSAEAITNSPAEAIRQYQNKQLGCRMELSKLLGTIGAPFLIQGSSLQISEESNLQYEQIHCLAQGLNPAQTSMSSSDFQSILIEFAGSHVKLLQTMNICIEIIKAGTALNLDASIGTVERVERAIYGRRVGRSSLSLDVPISFHSIRTLVSQAMLCQAESLDSILLQIVCIDGSSLPEETIGGEQADTTMYLNSLGGKPSVVTLSWMRSSQQQLAELLRDVLDITSTYPSINDVAMDQLRTSNSMTKQLCQHLASSVGLSGENRMEMQVSNQGSKVASNLELELSQIRKNLHSLYVSIWAMEDAINENEDSCDGYHHSKTLTGWWARITGLNDEICSSLQICSENYFQAHDKTATEDEDDVIGGASIVPLAAKEETVAELVDIPSQFEQHKPKTSKATKTAVFSGKGALKPTKEKSKGAKLDPDKEAAAPSLQSDPVAQHMLLGELRKRLQTLTLPEEEHESGDIPDNENCTHRTERTTAVPSFGALLVGELNSTIAALGKDTMDDEDNHSRTDCKWVVSDGD